MTDWIHRVLDEYIKEGDCCIDATMGKGGDTYYLCSKTGESGKVYAFDVQADALRQTREKLDKHKMDAELILDGHEHMKEYVKRDGSILYYVQSWVSSRWGPSSCDKDQHDDSGS